MNHSEMLDINFGLRQENLNLKTELKAYKFLSILFVLGYLIMTAGFMIAVNL